MTELDFFTLALSVLGVVVSVIALSYARYVYDKTTEQVKLVSDQVDGVKTKAEDALKKLEESSAAIGVVVGNVSTIQRIGMATATSANEAVEQLQLTLERLDMLVRNLQELRSEASSLTQTSGVILSNIGKASDEVTELTSNLQLVLDAHSWERASHTLEDFLRKVLDTRPPIEWVTVRRLRAAVNATRFPTTSIGSVLRSLEDQGDVELRGPPDSGQSTVRLLVGSRAAWRREGDKSE